MKNVSGFIGFMAHLFLLLVLIMNSKQQKINWFCFFKSTCKEGNLFNLLMVTARDLILKQ